MFNDLKKHIQVYLGLINIKEYAKVSCSGSDQFIWTVF